MSLPGLSGKNATEKRTHTGSFALQLINGTMKIVMKRSRFDSRARVAIIAGTEHPNPTSIGTKLFPGSPIHLINLSITKAARAIYPESSKIERHRNMNPTGGRNVASV
jgi:hypothetical protein